MEVRLVTAPRENAAFSYQWRRAETEQNRSVFNQLKKALGSRAGLITRLGSKALALADETDGGPDNAGLYENNYEKLFGSETFGATAGFDISAGYATGLRGSATAWVGTMLFNKNYELFRMGVTFGRGL